MIDGHNGRYLTERHVDVRERALGLRLGLGSI